MPRRGLPISVRLVTGCTALLLVLGGLHIVLGIGRSRSATEAHTAMLRRLLVEDLRRDGAVQLQLLAEAARVTLGRGDRGALEAILANLAVQDSRLLEVAVVDGRGRIVAHSAQGRAGVLAEGPVARLAASRDPGIQTSGEPLQGRAALTLGAAVLRDGAYLCSVVVVFGLTSVEAKLHQAASADRTIWLQALVVLLVVALGALLTVIEGRRLVRPIEAIAAQTERLARGEIAARVAVTSTDELGALGERFNAMAERMSTVLRHAQSERPSDKLASVERELEVATAIQATLVPAESAVDVQGARVAGHFKPSSDCGGDWWSYQLLDDDKLLLLIGDVTGHGVGAAMITAAAQGAASTVVALAERRPELHRLLATMNTVVHSTAKGKFVMTCFACIYDPRSQTLRFANAGHNFPYLYTSAKRLTSLVVRGNRLGDLAGSEYTEEEISVASGNVLYLYTDGIVECENLQGEQYGERRFRTELLNHARLPADFALESIVTHATEFYRDVPQKDDVTLVVVRFT